MGTETDLQAADDQELVDEWARLILPAAGGVVRPGVGSTMHPIDVKRLEAITEELERRGYTEHGGGVFTSTDEDAPDLVPNLS